MELGMHGSKINLSYGWMNCSIGKPWEEVDSTWAISIIFDVAVVVSSAWSRVNTNPAVFTVVAQARDAATKEGSIRTIIMHSAALVTCLIIKHIWFDFHLFVYVHVGDLKESAWHCTRKTHSWQKCHPTSAIWVPELRVTVNASTADIAIVGVEYLCQFLGL